MVHTPFRLIEEGIDDISRVSILNGAIHIIDFYLYQTHYAAIWLTKVSPKKILTCASNSYIYQGATAYVHTKTSYKHKTQVSISDLINLKNGIEFFSFETKTHSLMLSKGTPLSTLTFASRTSSLNALEDLLALTKGWSTKNKLKPHLPGILQRYACDL
jgi:hypothetical protein